MKSKLLSTFSMLRFFIVAALTVFCVSCDKTETTDSTGFILHYLGVTDIGPGMSYTLQAPTYKGSAPYDFTITKVTLDEETFSNNDNFVINAETGEITIQNTDGMTSGMYSISVGCYSNGKFFDFKDAVQVNMLLARPEGLTVEPAEVLVNQDEEKWMESSAQVTTEKDKHISILGYSIAQDESRPYLRYFDITAEGKIVIKAGTTEQQLIAGENYTLSLKLKTKVGDHMFADAVTFKVVSKPKNLKYDNEIKLPELAEVATEFNSAIPTVEGGKDGLKFTIQSVTPETDEFTIDESTGQIHLAEGHSLLGDNAPTYIFNITVSNTYGSQTFEQAYSVTITNKIEPIQPESFKYTTELLKIYQLGGTLSQKVEGTVLGDKITYELNNQENSDIVKAQKEAKTLDVDPTTGEIKITAEHTFPEGEHKIHVIATNPKTDKGFPAGYATLTIKVEKNPNDFEYVSWGTNMENEIPINTDGKKTHYIPTDITDTKQEKYRNLFRFINGRDVKNLSVQSIKMADENESKNTTFTYKKLENNYIGHDYIFNQINVTADGNITFKLQDNNNFSDGKTAANKTVNSSLGCVFQVIVTATGNNAPSVTKKIPIFISTPKPQSTKGDYFEQKEISVNPVIVCDPFVIKVNPKTQQHTPFTFKVYNIGASALKNEVIQRNFVLYGELPYDNFIWDYKTDYQYCNFDDNEAHPTGILNKDKSFLDQVWANCGFSPSNNSPFRYYDFTTGGINLGTKAIYIDAANCKLEINPCVWRGEDLKYPNGAVLGQMTFNFKGDIKGLEDIKNNGVSIGQYPLIFWLDETYEGN